MLLLRFGCEAGELVRGLRGHGWGGEDNFAEKRGKY